MAMARGLLQSGPVLDSLMKFIEELSENVARNVEERKAIEIHQLQTANWKLKENVDQLERMVLVRDNNLRELHSKLQQCEKVHGRKNKNGKKHVTVEPATVMVTSTPSSYQPKLGELMPGAIDHQQVQSQFNAFFSKYRRVCGTRFVTISHEKFYSIPCAILQIAFESCKECLLHSLNSALLRPRFCDDPQKNHYIQLAVKELHQCAMHCKQISTLKDHRLVVIEELKDIFTEPSPDSGLTIDCWEEKKKVFFALLNYTSITVTRNEFFKEAKHQILLKINQELCDEAMITEAFDIAIEMVTLVPPALVFNPLMYNEDWVEPKLNFWDNDSREISIYFRPALFFGANTGIAVIKAEVGNHFEKGFDKVLIYQKPDMNTRSCGNKTDTDVIASGHSL